MNNLRNRSHAIAIGVALYFAASAPVSAQIREAPLVPLRINANNSYSHAQLAQESKRPPRRAQSGKGAMIGAAVVGLVAGVYVYNHVGVGCDASDADDCNPQRTRVLMATFAGIGGTAIGGILGAFVGTFVRIETVPAAGNQPAALTQTKNGPSQ